MKRSILIHLLAVPAVAGLMFVAGCDNDDDVATGSGTAGETGTSPRPGGQMARNGDSAQPAAGKTGEGAQVSDAQIEQLSQALEDAQERAEAYKDQIEANVDIEGWGTGNAASEALGQVNERLDAVQAAVTDREWTTVATEMKTLMAMPMPAELKRQVQSIATELQGLNVPTLRDIGAGMEGMMPSGATPPTTRPGGGAGGTGGGQ